MSLLERAKADIQQITTNSDEWGVSMVLTAPNSATITIKGLHTKHNIRFDTDGNQINSLNAHVSFSEAVLVGYPVRNTNGQVDLIRHKVAVADSTGVVKNYMIKEAYPDETIGLIVCVLDSYIP